MPDSNTSKNRDSNDFSFEVQTNTPNKINTYKLQTPLIIQSPISEQTSPLHFDFKNIPETPTKMSNTAIAKDDFEYLSHQLSPMPGSWIVKQNATFENDLLGDTKKSHNYDQFLTANSASSSPIQYVDNIIDSPNVEMDKIHGILEDSVHGNVESDNYLKNKPDLGLGLLEKSESPDKKFDLQSSTGNLEFDVDDHKSNAETASSTSISFNDNNTTSNSVRTNDLRDISIDGSDGHNIGNDDEMDDKTPIVQQISFDQNSTPVANESKENLDIGNIKLKPFTNPLASIDAKSEIFNVDGNGLVEDLSKLTTISKSGHASASSSIYPEIPPRFIKNNKKYQSTTSSIYSELPPPVSSVPLMSISEAQHGDFLINEDAIPQRNIITASVSSSVYSSHPHTLSNALKMKTTSSVTVFPPTKENVGTHSEIDPKIDYSLHEKHKSRVSVRQKSLYQSYYDPKTGLPNSNSNTTNLSSLTSKEAVDALLTDSSSHSDIASLSTTNTTDKDDASALFVSAIYEFNSKTLDSENDSAICLSFHQDEVAFTYNLDDSGWGEVTLLSSLKRGWVPMNYFRSTMTEVDSEHPPPKSQLELAMSKLPLRLLLKYAGKFLLNPQNKPVFIYGELKGYTFDIECFNGITDGLRKLLIETDCISRSSVVVQQKPEVRKLRKKLLRVWADLIAKAKDYMGTVDTAKIEYLQLLLFQVLQRSITFLDTWGLESRELEEGKTNKPVDNDSFPDITDSIDIDLVYLGNPPLASYRINEVYNQLMTYLSLIAGRIDLVEHNIQGFSILGVVVGQINLLVNEYFFIMKLIKAMVPGDNSIMKASKRPKQIPLVSQLRNLDLNGEKLEQLVEELNSYIKVLHEVAKRRKNAKVIPLRSNTIRQREQTDMALYFYSREGGAVVVCSCKMIELASSVYRILKNMINFTEDFQLPANRKYPNYIKMNVSPEVFIKKCLAGLMHDKSIKTQVNNYKKLSLSMVSTSKLRPTSIASKRFSLFKTGNSSEVQLNSDGLDFLAGVVSAEASPFVPNMAAFDNQSATYELYDFDPEDEILRSSDNKLLGISFRSLVALLTDEDNPPDYFFISTFFLTFRIFADSSMLLEALIARFDVSEYFLNKSKKELIANNNNNIVHSSAESKIKNRRRLVCKAFELWLESYWKLRSDYVLLAPLINFFNEGMKPFLPVESYRLLVIASKLIGHPPVENMKDSLNYYNNIDNNSQLLPRKISPKSQKKQFTRLSISNAGAGALINEMDAYNSFLDDIETYDLEKIETHNSGNSSRKSLSFSLNIELKNSDSSNILLTKPQLTIIESVIMSYRKMLGNHWLKNLDKSAFSPGDTQTLIDAWWNASQESWKILNDDLVLLNFNGLEIAKQLTLVESKMFCSIQVGELLNQNFTTKKLYLNLSPNIQRSILFTNLLSDYVIESILKPKLGMKQRIHGFKCWLKIAISCLYLRNFNSLASIMTSLQSFLISRVTAIWDGLSEKYRDLFQYLASIIHPDKNYSVYREKLRDFLSSNLEEDLDIPIVPYLSLFLQDLTFVVDGNPNFRKNPKSFLDQKLINIDKYFKITKIISDIQTLQISYKDIGELGAFYNTRNTDIVRSETIKNLKAQMTLQNDVLLADMFDIAGIPMLQELILLEIWKVKQTNSRDDDRSWKLSCAIQPRE